MLIFQAKEFVFPYRNLSFPGQHTEEKILFVTREGKIMLYLRWLFVLTVGITLFFINWLIFLSLKKFFSFSLVIFLSFFIVLGTIFFCWWFWILWKKSVFIITTRRLTKFIFTTPFTHYQLSLGLDQVVDTGAYQKGYFQALTGLGYFVARSAAGNIKNFKIVNISFAEDLHNYVNKLLFVFNQQKEKIDRFRPFIPHLKGEARREFVKKVAPEYLEE